jgi:hypothetical protein
MQNSFVIKTHVIVGFTAFLCIAQSQLTGPLFIKIPVYVPAGNNAGFIVAIQFIAIEL